MAGALPYMQLFPADYLADTQHLSTLEHGAYLLLMFNYWQTGKALSAKDQRSFNKRLMSVTKVFNEEFEHVKETLQEFFTVVENEDGIEWRHERIEKDLAAVRAKSIKASLAGKVSAAKRAIKKEAVKPTNDGSKDDEQKSNERSTDVKETLEECSTEDQRNGNHTDTDTDTDIKNNKDKSLLSLKTKNKKFSMFEGWVPESGAWEAIAKSKGILTEECTEESLQEFVTHWCNSPDDLFTEAQWQYKLAKDLKRKRNFKASQNGKNNPNTRQNTTSIKHTATDTSWNRRKSDG